MLFLVVGTPWKTPRSSRLCCPDCGDGWFGAISSTKTATLRMRLRNSCGSESSASSTTLTKCSRFILHPLINKGTLTPSSRRRFRRHQRHHPCRRPRLPLRLLPRLALVEGGHRRLPTDQKGLSRHTLDVFCSCPMVRLVAFGNAATNGSDARLVRAGAAAILMWRTWDACVLTFLSRGVRSHV